MPTMLPAFELRRGSTIATGASSRRAGAPRQCLAEQSGGTLDDRADDSPRFAPEHHLRDLARLRRSARPHRPGLRATAGCRGDQRAACTCRLALRPRIRAAYGESPYFPASDAAHQTGDGAAASNGDLSVTEISFAVGARRWVRSVPASPGWSGCHPAYRSTRPTRPRSLPPCIVKQVARPVRNRSTDAQARLSMTASSHTGHSPMHLTIHSTFLPHNDPDCLAGVLPRYARFSKSATTSATTACAGCSRSVSQPGTSIVLCPPGVTQDSPTGERRAPSRDDGQRAPTR